MSNLTAFARWNIDGDRENRQFTVKNSTSLYVGGYCAYEASSGVSTGYVTNPSDADGVKLLGIISAGGEGSYDASGAWPNTITGDTSATQPPTVLVDTGSKYLWGAAVTGASTIAHEGRKVYLSTSNLADLTLTPTTYLPAVGEIVRFNTSSSFDVRLYSAAEMVNPVVTVDTVYLGSVPMSTVADGDIRTGYVLRGQGKINAFYALTEVVTTDADAATLLNLEIGGTNVTGGVITIDDTAGSTLIDTLGGKISGTAITAANTFVDGDLLDVEAASTTAYTDGQVGLYIEIERTAG